MRLPDEPLPMMTFRWVGNRLILYQLWRCGNARVLAWRRVLEFRELPEDLRAVPIDESPSIEMPADAQE